MIAVRCERFGIDLINDKYRDKYSDGFYALGNDEILSWIRKPIPRAEGITYGVAGVHFPDENLYVLLKLGPLRDSKGRGAYWLRAAVMTEKQYLEVDAHPYPVFQLLERETAMSRDKLHVTPYVNVKMFGKGISYVSYEDDGQLFIDMNDRSFQDKCGYVYRWLYSYPICWSRMINFRVGKFIKPPPETKFRLTVI